MNIGFFIPLLLGRALGPVGRPECCCFQEGASEAARGCGKNIADGSHQTTAGMPAKQTALCRGVVEDFAVDDLGRTVWMIAAREQGMTRRYHVAVTPSVRLEPEDAGIGNGSELEVLYTNPVPMDNGRLWCVEAVAVRVLPPALQLTRYRGRMVEVTTDPDRRGFGGLLLDPIGTTGMRHFFWYTPETLFRTRPPNCWKEGEPVQVFYNGICTRSIPPQSTALEVRPDWLQGDDGTGIRV